MFARALRKHLTARPPRSNAANNLEDVDAKERAQLINQYRDGYYALMQSLDGITEDELDRTALDGWTPRQIVHHLADAELIGAVRVRYLVAHPSPAIQGYDGELFADRLMNHGPIEPSLRAVRGAREATAPILEKMTDEMWTRAGVHSERGHFTAEDWLRLQAPHAHEHAAQIRRARGMKSSSQTPS